MSLRVKLLFMAPVALLPIALIAASKEIRASSVQWKEHFGTYSAEPHTSFCLMARGFFRSPTENRLKQ